MPSSAAKAIDQLLEVTRHAAGAAQTTDDIRDQWRQEILQSLLDISGELLQHSQAVGAPNQPPSKTAMFKIMGFLGKLDTALHQLERWLRYQKYEQLRKLYQPVKIVREAYWDEDASGPIIGYNTWLNRRVPPESNRIDEMKEDEESAKLRRRAAQRLQEFADELYDLVYRA